MAARLLLGGTLLVAGLLKITQIEASIQSVRLYQLLPWESTAIVGASLPVLEIAVGLLLLTGTFTRAAALAGSGLMLAFILGIASVWARGISIDCGCFSPGGEIDPSQTQYPLEIARDLGLLAAGIWVAWRPKAPFAVDAWLFGPAERQDEESPNDPEQS